MKILFIDACAREDSRTRRLARVLIGRLKGDVERIQLTKEAFVQLKEEKIDWRGECSHNKDFSDDYFKYAKQFAEADTIVIAAPFWDLSFPACLKQYIETITVTGLTFYYSEEGIPVGLCKTNKLYYVTTAGGPIMAPEFGYGYIRAMAREMYGIKECRMFSAENLDIIGNDVEKIMQEAEQAVMEAEL